MKKTLMGLGALTTVAVPVAATVSCTLVKKDKIEDYVNFKQFDSITSLTEDFDETNGVNLGVTPWLSSFWKERANKLLGVLNHKENNYGIIASHAFGRGDVAALTRLFETQTWFEFADYSTGELNSPLHVSSGFNNGHITGKTSSPNGNSIVKPGYPQEWMKMINFSNGFAYDGYKKIKTSLHGKAKDFDAWTKNTNNFFTNTNVFISNNKTVAPGVNEKVSYSRLEGESKSIDLDGNGKLKDFMTNQINRLQYLDSDSSDTFDRFSFTQKDPNEKVKMYIYYNFDLNAETIKYDPGSEIASNNIKQSIVADYISREFKHFGINLDVKFIKNADINEETKKPWTEDEVAKLANSDEKAIVIMPIDPWLENIKSEEQRGSLLLQRRGPKSIGEASLESVEHNDDSLKIDEAEIMEQINELYALFPDFFNKSIDKDYSIEKVIEHISKETQNEFVPSSELAKWIMRLEKIMSNNFMKNWIWKDFSKGIQNKFKNILDDRKKRVESLPLFNDGRIEYLDSNFYSIYHGEYVISPDISLKNETQKLFVEQIEKHGPKTSNGFEWEINAREELPLPITVGGIGEISEADKSDIIEWIKAHFII